MKRKMRVLAALLAAVMMFNDSGVAYATEIVANEAVESVSGNDEIAPVEESIVDDAMVSEGDAEVNEDVSTGDVTDEVETEAEVETEVEVEEESEEVIEEAETTVSANEVEETEIEEAPKAEEIPEGFNFTGMELSEEMVAQKAEIAAVVASLEGAVAGEDYIDGSMIFFANSEEEAKAIAAAYNTENVFFQSGIAMIQLPYATVDVLTEAADMSNNLPAVYPNIIYKTTNLEKVEGTAVERKNTVSVKQMAEEKIQAELSALDAKLAVKKAAEEAAQAETTAETVVEVKTEELAPLSSVKYADDADYAKQWHHDVVGTEDAWKAGITGEGVKVAVIDSGIDSDHPDLKANIVAVESTVYKTDRYGYPIDERGNRVEDVEDLVFLSGEDENGHGTHVAGIIAADDNTIGGVGVAPDADIYSIRALNAQGSGSSLMICWALEKAIELNVDVVNMSLGSHVYDYAEAPLIKKLIDNGTVVVAAAGNEGYYLYDQKSYPAAYPSVISVAATYKVNGYQDLSWFSTFGNWVTIAAPGGYAKGSVYDFTGYDANDIYSTYLNGTYAFMAGTSQASPVTAGTVALVLQSREEELGNLNGKKKVDKVKNILLASENDEYYFSDYGYVYGGLNTAAAVLSSVKLDAPTFKASKVIDDIKAKQPTIAAGYDEYITVSSTSENAIIYVTVNGKNPTANNWQYAGYGSVKVPADKSGTMTLKAVVELGDKKASATQKYKLVATAQSIEAKYGAEQNVVIGGSIKMPVVFYPEYTTDKKMEWVSSDKEKFTVNKTNGTVKCTKKAKAGDTAIITGTLKADKTKVVTVKVTAVEKSGVSVELKNASKTLELATYVTDQGLADYYDLSKDVTAKNCTVTYTSSNKKVAYVDENTGLIIPLSKGSCKITVQAMDGSKKKVVKKVTVVNPISYIGIDNLTDGSWTWSTYGDTGAMEVNVAKGCSIKLSTYVSGYYGNAASNKKINWTTTNDAVKVKGNKLVCSKTARVSSNYVTVTGTAADKSGIKVVLYVRVWDKPYAIAWGNDSSDMAKNVKTTVEHRSAVYFEDPGFWYVKGSGTDMYKYFSCSMSNPDVCYWDVDEDGYLILVGAKKGTCVITYKALDGSNLTAKCTVTVK